METSPAPPFLLSANRVEVNRSAENITHWKSAMSQDKAARLPCVFQPDFSELMRSICDAASLVEEKVEGVGKRWIEPLDRVGKVLSHVLSDQGVLAWVGEVGDRGTVSHVSGKLASYSAENSSFLDWHDDNFEGRRIAIVIDLSEHAFEGGEFEMRMRGASDPHFRHRLQGFGTGLIFRVAEDVEHRLLPVTAGGPRRTFAGWFFSLS
jgi:Rps23 Pro-64 3,4-dihydroxylase Tpa1-like proline 4-hydroxylase